MADRYWVGGTAAWDATAGTKWALTSGGAGGQAVPTAADDVFFDAASGAVTCTISGSRVAKSINCTGFTGTLAGTSTPALTISGSLTLDAGMTLTYAGTTTFNGTGTLTSAGKTFGPVNISGSGITVTLGDALNIGSNTLTVTQGTFDTANYNVTAGAISSSNTNVRTIDLGSSAVTLTSNSAFSTSTTTNLTFNAGTSTIVLTGTNVTFSAAVASALGLTFYNLELNQTSAIQFSITGINTFNNLTVTGPASAGVVQVTFNSRQTINGTLSTTGTAGNRRVWFRGVTYGIAQTLTINATPSLTDADFRDIYVIGTAAPISGTRIGDLRGCRDITFDTPKTVYWNLAGAQNWSANGWSDTSTGTPNTNFFPLAQDTATFTNAGSVTGTITMDSAVPYTGTVDMSGRTSAMTLNLGAAQSIYGDWKNGSGTTLSGAGTLTYSGRNTQTITSAGKTFIGPLTVDSYGGSVELSDALNIGNFTITVTNGTFDTKNYNVTASSLSSSNSNVRAITLGSSTVTLSSATAFEMSTSTNATVNSGTSSIVLTNTNPQFRGGGNTFYDVSTTSTSAGQVTLTGVNTFNNLSFTAPASAGLRTCISSSNQTITGTFTASGASPVRRVFIFSSILGTTLTYTVGTLAADDCDFRDIAITGTAAGSSPTRAGDCGGNSGITFPAPKTVYWNLAGTQSWSATAWASSSGGTPDINNFPLAQDTAVFDDTGSAGTVRINSNWNVGTFDASLRTGAMTFESFSTGGDWSVYGDFSLGTGLTLTQTSGAPYFRKRGNQTITTNGVTFAFTLYIESFDGTVLLGDAFNSTSQIQSFSGAFDAASYNVTIPTGIWTNTSSVKLKMGSGTWTLTSISNIWSIGTGVVFYKGTANIVLSDTSTSARTFGGGGLSYNKLTIGGTTGTSTLTISGNNQFTELASTKTVAHTIALGSTTQTFGKWTVTGTAGNVVTLTGTGTSHILAGACTDSIDYLAMGSIGFSATSPGEFYAGANSTGTAAAPVYRTAKPADSTRYWVGGTGNWSDTNRWSTSSGGAGGASVPRSHDDVVFDSASNATAYTATVNAVTGGIRMKSLTIAGPASGNVTLAGSTAMVGIHGNVTLPATGLTRTYTGAITLSSNSTGLTFTTNGVTLASSITVNGVDCSWSLGSALNTGSSGLTLTNGSIDFATYNFTGTGLSSDTANSRTIALGTGTMTLSGSTGFNLGTTETNRANLTLTASTSQINLSSGGFSDAFSGNNQTFYNVSFTNISAHNITLNGANTFNNLSFTGITAAGLKNMALTADQTVTGTLTFSAGTNATMRHFVRSNTIGTTRTITAAAVSMTDVDFRDITIAGAAAPASGTRLGDCKGNSGITFTAAANKYWNLAGGGNWSATGWATSSGGTPNVNDFPLAQDTCFFEATGLNSGATVTVNAAYNIGTIDMSARTTNTMTLATGSVVPVPAIYGNWINGTGTTLTGTAGIAFNGRTLQTITSAGKNFAQYFSIDSPGGTVQLLDALTTSNSIGNSALTSGTLDLNNYTYTGSAYAFAGTATKTLAIGNQSLVLGAGGSCFNYIGSNLTVTGTGTISLTSISAKTFAGGGIDYSGITLDQGGAGTLTITGNNTFANITNTYSATGATTIAFGTTTQRVGSFTATGAAGNVLTLTGTSASSPATLVLTSGTVTTPDYLTITGIRAYDLNTTWYAGANSTNNGSLGWLFQAAGGTTFDVSFSDTATGDDAFSAALTLSTSFSDTTTGSDTISASFAFDVSFSDTATGDDAISAACIFLSATSESATGADTATVAGSTFNTLLNETATGQDTTSATGTFNASLADIATGADAFSAIATLDAAFSDTATGADAISAGLVFVVSLSDTATGADAFSAGLAFSVSFSDTATGADAVSVAASTFGAAFSDTATGADALTTTGALNVSLGEFATGADVIAIAASIFSPTFADTVTALESVSGGLLLVASVAENSISADIFAVSASVFGSSFVDTAQVLDIPSVAASTFGSVFTDTAQILDAPTTTATFNVAFVDTAVTADSPAALMTFVSVSSDTATASDNILGRYVVVSMVSESATGSEVFVVAASVFNTIFADATQGLDAVTVVASVFSPSFADTVAGTDTFVVTASTFTPSFADTVQALDVPSIAGSVFLASTTDTAQIQDTPAALAAFSSSFSDTATGADALAALMIFASSLDEAGAVSDAAAVAASTFNPSFADTAQALDAPAVAASTFGTSFSDTAQIQDAPAALMVFPVSFSDTATAADALAAQMVFATAIAELATGTDATSALVIFVSSVSETASGFDVAAVAASTFNASFSALAVGQDTPAVAGSTFNVSLSDAGTITDLVAGNYLWNPIDDTQSANWQNVVTAQSPGWVQINDAQGPNWVEIQT